MADLLRNLSLLVSLVAVAGAVGVRRGRCAPRQVTAAVVATLYCWTALLAVEAAGSWWHFTPSPTGFLGMPLETSLGWALAWGALPALAGGRPWLWLLGLGWVDVLLMPRLGPLVTLHDDWLVGEAVLLLAVAAPTLALGHATRTRRHLGLRVTLQAATYAGLFLWLVPSLALARDGLGWADVVDHPLPLRAVLLTLGVLVGVPALAAVAELARVGGGTPWPWDPPERLVTTGPYAWVANPMQLSMTLLQLVLAVAAWSPTLLLGAVVMVAFGEAVAEPHERRVLAERWAAYDDYRRHVRAWRPRRRPWVEEPAVLWVDAGCTLCTATGLALDRLGPTGLVRRDAHTSPVRLTRMRWTRGGAVDRGVAAFGRALEHTSLPWAWVGWAVRLPGVTWVLQAVADACGLGPRETTPTHQEAR